jgi:2'-5' RNA ligase
MRSFLAVEIPGSLKEALRSIQDELRSCGADVRWVRPESVHLTLKFLGEIDPNLVSNIHEAVESAITDYVKMAIEVRGLGCFPRLKQPRVIWVGLAGDTKSLSAMQEAIEKAVSPFGFPRENRPFRPHLTIGRVRSNKRRDALIEAIRPSLDLHLGSFTVESVVQFESQLHPSGARYISLWEAPLGRSDDG